MMTSPLPGLCRPCRIDNQHRTIGNAAHSPEFQGSLPGRKMRLRIPQAQGRIVWLLLFHQTPHITKRVLHLTNTDPINAAYRTTVHLAAVIVKIDNRLLQMLNPPIGSPPAPFGLFSSAGCRPTRVLSTRKLQYPSSSKISWESQQPESSPRAQAMMLVTHERNLQDGARQPSSRLDLSERCHHPFHGLETTNFSGFALPFPDVLCSASNARFPGRGRHLFFMNSVNPCRTSATVGR